MNKLKKIIIGTVLTAMVGTVSVSALNIQTFSDSLTVYLNNIDVYEKSENKPLIINDRTVVPLRPIFEAIGWEVEYDDKNGVATFSDGKTICSFKNDDSSVSKTDSTGTEITTKLDVPATIYNGNFYIPIRAFCELWGMDIKWDGNSRSVYIKNNNQTSITEIKPTPKPTEKPNPTTKPVVTATPVVTENPTINTSDTADFDLTYEAALDQAKMFLESQGASDDMSINGNKKPVKHNGEWAYEFELTSKTLDLNYVKKILLYIYEGDYYETEEVK